MPGKVNPVIPEVVLQVAAQVIGNDTAVTVAGTQGAFELNVRVPVIARNLFESIRILTSASQMLAEKCVDGLEANEETLLRHAESTQASHALKSSISGKNPAPRSSRRRCLPGTIAGGHREGRGRGTWTRHWTCARWRAGRRCLGCSGRWELARSPGEPALRLGAQLDRAILFLKNSSRAAHRRAAAVRDRPPLPSGSASSARAGMISSTHRAHVRLAHP